MLRAVLETGTTRDVEEAIQRSEVLLTSRLSLVEAARALLRLRTTSSGLETHLADAERSIASVWRRCEIWELTPAVCELASHVAPSTGLRTLDALHLATFILARRRIDGLELLSADTRLREAAGIASP